MKLNERYHYHPETSIPKPKCLDEMLRIASILSEDFPEVRVDLYVINGQPYIGELTFSSGYGFFTNEYYRHLGDLTILPDAIKWLHKLYLLLIFLDKRGVFVELMTLLTEGIV